MQREAGLTFCQPMRFCFWRFAVCRLSFRYQLKAFKFHFNNECEIPISTLIKATTMRLFFILLSIVTSAVWGQDFNNPNNLPRCPKPDLAKGYDVGVSGRTGAWNNCWGRYKVEFSESHIGDVLEGEWRNGSLHGMGMYYCKAETPFKGDKYVGEFKEGSFHGRGTYAMASGNKYVGEWKDSKYHGQGTYTYANGEKYVGEFKDGKEHGLGTHTFADGREYFGEYKDGKWHGQGIFTTQDGTQLEVTYEDGQLISESKISVDPENDDVTTSDDRASIESERQQLAEDRRRFEEQRRQQVEANKRRMKLYEKKKPVINSPKITKQNRDFR